MCVFCVKMGFRVVQSRVRLLSPLGASPPREMTSRPVTVVRGLGPTSPGRCSPALGAQRHGPSTQPVCQLFPRLEGPPLSLRGHASITWVPLLKGHLLRETVTHCDISRDTCTPSLSRFFRVPSHDLKRSLFIFMCVFPGGLSPRLCLGSKKVRALSCLL